MRGFRQIALVDGELMFPSFGACVGFGDPRALISEAPRWSFFAGVDLSSERRPGNAIVTIGLDPDHGYRVPVDLRRGDWPSNETAEQVLDVCETWNPRLILVENNGYQSAILDWIRTIKHAPKFLPIEPFTTTGHRKYDPTQGLPGLQVEFARGGWRILVPDHRMDCRCPWCVWVREMRYYPTHPTTDTVMATWFAREALFRVGGSFQEMGEVQKGFAGNIADEDVLGAFGPDPSMPFSGGGIADIFD